MLGLAGLKSYLQEAKAELTKVSWPSRQQTFRLTGAVLVVSLLVGTYIGFWDWLLNQILEKFVSS